MSLCLIGVGSNLGNRRQNLDRAVHQIGAHPSVKVVRSSRWLQSDPIGGPDNQDLFLNGAVCVDTALTPQRLLDHLLAIERRLGRAREVRWAPRTIDLDLLLVAGQVVDEPGLCVPHPWMAIRPFVLQPAAEIAPELLHPTIGWSLNRLWTHLQSAPNRVLLIAPSIEVSDTAIVKALKHLPIKLHYSQSVATANRSGVERTASTSDEDCWEIYCFHVDATGGNPAREPQRCQDHRHPQQSLDRWLDEAPLAKLRIVLHSTAQDQWLTNACTQPNAGPFLVLDANDKERLQHDVQAALEGLS